MSTKFTDGLIETVSNRLDWADYKTSRELIKEVRDHTNKSKDRNEYAPGDQIEIYVQDDNAWMDLMNSYLRFTIQISGADGVAAPAATTRIRNVFDVLSELKIFSAKSTTELETIKFVNRWMNILTRISLEKDYAETMGHLFGLFDIEGYIQNETVMNADHWATAAAADPVNPTGPEYTALLNLVNARSRSTNMESKALGNTRWTLVGNTQRYDVCIPLFLISGFCNQDKYINLKALGGLLFQFNLETSVKALISGSADTYKILNPRIQSRMLLMDPVINDKYMSQAKGSSGVSIFYQSVASFQESIGAGVTSLAKVIGAIKGSAIAVFHAMTLADNDVQSLWSIGNFKPNTWSSYRLVWGSQNFPSSVPISDKTHLMMELRKAVGDLSTTYGSWLLNRENYFPDTAHSFIWGIDLEKEPGHMNGISLATVQLQYELNLTGAAANGSTLWTFLLHEVNLKINNDFTITKTE
jgi:hypothetical protein